MKKYKPPRVRDPNCKTNLEQESRLVRRNTKRANKETELSCTIGEDFTCCYKKNCVHVYPIETIVQVRKYMNKLSFPDRRRFVEDRVEYSGFEREEIKKGDHLLKFYLEDPESLKIAFVNLHRNTVGRIQLAVPNATILKSVCVRGFMHISGLERGVIYDHHRLKVGCDPTAEDRKIDADRPRKIRCVDAPLKETVVIWMRQLAEIATVLPNCCRGFKILPYRTPNAVHAIFVREMEQDFNCHWIDEADAEYDYQGGNRWDDGIVDAPGRIPDLVVPAEVAAKLYRYGNTLLGKSGGLPEDKRIASLTYFKKSWHDDPIAGLCHCRAFMPFAK